MAYALISSVAAGSSNDTDVTTGSIDTTGADFIVVMAGFYANGADIAISDSKGNSYTAMTPQTTTVLVRGRMFYVQGPTVGSGHTFTATNTSAIPFPSITVAAFSGSVSSPLDQDTGTFNDSASTINPGSVTPTETNELVVSGLAFDSNSSGAVSIGGGFTITNTVQHDGAHHEGVSLAYLIQTSIAAANPQWNVTNSTDLAAVIATFRDTPSGGGGGAGGNIPFGSEGSAFGGGRSFVGSLR